MFKIEPNEGRVDRLLRLVFGVSFLVLGIFFLSDLASYGLILAGLVLVFTALTGFCSLYRLLGINTCGNRFCDLQLEERHASGRIKKKRKEMGS